MEASDGITILGASRLHGIEGICPVFLVEDINLQNAFYHILEGQNAAHEFLHTVCDFDVQLTRELTLHFTCLVASRSDNLVN